MMTKEARQIAVEWVEANWENYPEFVGARFGGSINVTPDDAPWPDTSDVDISILSDAPRSLSQVHYRGVLLEVSTRPMAQFDLSWEAVVSDFRHAIHYSVPSIIKDPTGRLQAVHERVRVEYPRKKWVTKRCEGATERANAVLDGWLQQIGFNDDSAWGAVFALYYATFVAAEILALADLRNPTVRKSFVVSRQVLAQCGRLDLQESLLQALGAADLTPAQVDGQLAELRPAFEQASTVIRNPFFFSDMLQLDMISSTLGGIQEIIDMGLHREAVFWLQSVRAVAQRAIESDAPDHDKDHFQQGYSRILDELGLRTTEQVEIHRG